MGHEKEVVCIVSGGVDMRRLYLRLENINRYAQATAYLRLENRNKYAKGWEIVTCSCAMISVSARFEDVRGDRKLFVRQDWQCTKGWVDGVS